MFLRAVLLIALSSCTTVIPKNVFDACDDVCEPLSAVEVGKKFTGGYCCKCSDGSVENLVEGLDIPERASFKLQEDSLTYTLVF